MLLVFYYWVLTSVITCREIIITKESIKNGVINDNDNLAAEDLVRISFAAALRKSDNSWTQHRRRMEFDLHKRDEFSSEDEWADPRHFYDITIPNDEFRIHDKSHEGESHHDTPHEGELHHEHEEHEPEHEQMMKPSLAGDPHPAVEQAHNMETNVNTLLASASNLKMQSVELQGKAAELEKQAGLLHANAGGPVVHSQDQPMTAEDTTHTKEIVHEAHTTEEDHFSHSVEKQEKCCQDGSGPERGGSSARPVVNGQVTGNGDQKAPPPPPLGPPTYEHDSPIQPINIGYPMFNLPHRTGDLPIPDYLKPLPPVIGNNPYEVLTSSSLNGTAYKTHPFGVDHTEAHSHPFGVDHTEAHSHPLFTQKYVISLKGVTNEKTINIPNLKGLTNENSVYAPGLPVIHNNYNTENTKIIQGVKKTIQRKNKKKYLLKKLTKKELLKKKRSKSTKKRKHRKAKHTKS